MTQAETAAQMALRQIVKELDALRRRLLDVHESLPPSPTGAAMLSDEEEPDVSTEIRTVIECVLQDSLQPAIRDLQAAADYRARL